MILQPWPVNFTRRFCSSISPAKSLVDIVALGVGSLQDMESSLDNLEITLTPSLVTHVIDSARNYDITTSRRLLRFLSWSRRSVRSGELGDDILNRAIRAFSGMKDPTAMRIAVSDLHKEGRRIDPETFVNLSETYVKLGRPEEAVRLFRDIEEKKLIKWRDCNIGEWSSMTAIVEALCAKGHARKAEGVLWHHKDKAEPDLHCHHRSLILHGWSVYGNAKEARRVTEDMKASGNCPSLISYHDLLRCICKRNLRFNPSALVLEAANLMAEMRSSGVLPTTVTFNILLSCLGRARRVKEACRIMISMMRGEEGELSSTDSITYYLVVRLLYLTKRFGRGNKILDQMIEEGKGRMMPKADDRFYHSLIGVLIGVENVDDALKLFERMKKSCCCGNETYRPTYDLLIEKLCRIGRFDLGRSLWDEAIQKGITLQCSSDLLDPVKAPQVFNPMMKPPVDKITLGKSKRGTVVSRTKSGFAIKSTNPDYYLSHALDLIPY